MAVLPLPRRTARAGTEPRPVSEVLAIPGTPAEVAAVLAAMINDGWSFDALPVTRGGGLWLVSGRRPATPEQLRRHA